MHKMMIRQLSIWQPYWLRVRAWPLDDLSRDWRKLCGPPPTSLHWYPLFRIIGYWKMAILFLHINENLLQIISFVKSSEDSFSSVSWKDLRMTCYNRLPSYGQIDEKSPSNIFCRDWPSLAVALCLTSVINNTGTIHLNPANCSNVVTLPTASYDVVDFDTDRRQYFIESVYSLMFICFRY